MNWAARIGELRNANPEQLAERAGAVLPPWVSLLLVIAIAWKLAGLSWTLLPEGELPAAAVPARTSDGAGAAPSYSLADIVNAHLFGVAASEAPVQTRPLEDIPEERGALTLRGTIAGREPDNGLAIIAEDRGEEKVYAVGDPVRSGAKLYQVYPDRVILERAGQLTSLRLPRESEGGGPVARASRPAARPAVASRSSVSLRQVIAQDPGRLTDIVRPQPVFANGQQRGYRVYPGRNRQQFANLGLQAGDLVTEINGMALTDPQSGMEIFRSLGDGTQVTVTVERNGQPEVLVLDTSNLATSDESSDEADESDSGDISE